MSSDRYPLPQRRCTCGLRIYQFNFHCVGCGRAIGTCGRCHTLTSFSLQGDEYYCDQADCGAGVQQCSNRLQNSVCNGMPVREPEEDTAAEKLCEYCELTTVIPPLGDPVNLLRWQKLELAKRQLHSQLRALGLPPYAVDPDVPSVPPLTYEFVEKRAAKDGAPVMMGHCDGKITMLAEEADSDYRERQRENLGEPQRTLVGHFRHEIGHYIDLVGVSPARRGEYIALFGDPQAIDYGEAMQAYYANHADPLDPGITWQSGFVSKYATMHPWEDFAETVDAFLSLAAVMQVAHDHGMVDVPDAAALVAEEMLERHREIALLSNELNFSRGLGMLVPEIISEQVRQKLAFVASLCRSTAGQAAVRGAISGDGRIREVVTSGDQVRDPQAAAVLKTSR